MSHRSVPLAALLLLALSASACSDRVTFEGLPSSLPEDSIDFSISAQDSGRNLVGGTLTATMIVLSDREDLCAEVESSGSLDLVSDVFAVQVLALRNSDQGAGAGEIESNSSFEQVFFDQAASQGFVSARVLHRQGGATVADFRSRNLVDLASVSEGRFQINSTSSGANGSRFGGTFRADIGADLLDPERFDVDVNDDGAPDFASASGSLRGRFAGARSCSALADAVAVPDVEPDDGEACDDYSHPNPNPGGEPILEVVFGEVCSGTVDRMTYNVDSGCTTRLDLTVPDAYDDSGNQVRDVDLQLFYAGGGGSSATSHTQRVEREISDHRVYLEGGGDSLGAVTARVTHRSGSGEVPYTLQTVVDCP